MGKRVVKLTLILSLFLFVSFAFALAENIAITNAKMATEIDDNLMPVNPTGAFAKDAPIVFCWFEWRNATINTPLVAKWYYVTDDLHVLDYPFNIPRKQGTGSVSLSMPKGKVLPSGVYRVDLVADGKALRSVNFKVLEK